MNQYDPTDKFFVQPAEGPYYNTNCPPPPIVFPPTTPPPTPRIAKKIQLIPFLVKHQESSTLQLACLQKAVYFSTSTLHTLKTPLELDRQLHFLQLALLLQDITKSQLLTITIFKNFFQYRAESVSRRNKDPFYNPWQTPQLMPPPSNH